MVCMIANSCEQAVTFKWGFPIAAFQKYCNKYKYNHSCWTAFSFEKNCIFSSQDKASLQQDDKLWAHYFILYIIIYIIIRIFYSWHDDSWRQF